MRAPVLLLMLNFAPSRPETMLKVTVSLGSASVAVTVLTVVVFSGTEAVAVLVKTGDSSLVFVTVMVNASL